MRGHHKIKALAVGIAALTLVGSLSGCGQKYIENDLTAQIKAGDTLTPSLYSTSNVTLTVAGLEFPEEITPLDRLTTHSVSGFRTNFDRIFNINVVTVDNKSSKQGCLFVSNDGENDIHNGNSSMRDAFRNKSFNSYISSDNVSSEISNLCKYAYSDVDPTSRTSYYASLNAYFNVLPDMEELKDSKWEDSLNGEIVYGGSDTSIMQTEFNPTDVLSRADFYAAFNRATGDFREQKEVDPIDQQNLTNMDVDTSIMGDIVTMVDLGYLTIDDGSLNKDNINIPISKMEAVYMVVNRLFGDYQSATSESNSESTASSREYPDKVFGYTINQDLRTQIMAVKTSEESEWTPSTAVEANTLSHMLKYPESGIDASMADKLLIAEEVGLLKNMSTALTGPVTKEECIQLFVNAFEAENRVYGYLTSAEYPSLGE